MSAKLETKSVFTGTTSPVAIRRTLALPETETPSYAPVWIRLIMSSELAPSFVLTLQPVADVNSSVSTA